MSRKVLPDDTHQTPFSPADQRALVAIDLGAESCRVSLLRWKSSNPSIQLIHRFSNHANIRPDGLRWDIHLILSELEHGMRNCASIATEGIRSIAVDGWAVDYVRLDAHGNAIADPFCYRDERTLSSRASLHHCLSAESMREITGIQLLRINTAYQFFADSPRPTPSPLAQPPRIHPLPSGRSPCLRAHQRKPHPDARPQRTVVAANLLCAQLPACRRTRVSRSWHRPRYSHRSSRQTPRLFQHPPHRACLPRYSLRHRLHPGYR